MSIHYFDWEQSPDEFRERLERIASVATESRRDPMFGPCWVCDEAAAFGHTVFLQDGQVVHSPSMSKTFAIYRACSVGHRDKLASALQSTRPLEGPDA